MKKTLSTMFMISAVSLTTVQAQDVTTIPGKVRCSDRSEVVLPAGAKYSMRDHGTRKSLTPIKPTKADEEMVTVTLKVVSAEDPEDGLIYNQGVFQVVEFEGKEASVQVPKGKYDMLVEFYSRVGYYVFKENVEVTGDMVLEFDQNEATIPVEINYYDENNTEFRLETRQGGEVVDPGTADEILKLTSLIHKDYGYATHTLDFGYKPEGYPMEFYVNQLSDKYYLGQTATIIAGSHYYALKTVIDKFDGTVYNSDPTNLQRLATEFETSPAMLDHKYVKLPGVETTYLLDGYILGSSRVWAMGDPEDEGKVITYVDCPEADVAGEYKMNMTARPLITDGVEGEEGDEKFTFIIAQHAIGNTQQGIKYLVSGCDLQTGFNVPVGETSQRFYPGHPDFSFATADGTAHFGTSVPMMIYRPLKEIIGTEVYNFDQYRYMGRYGESRETDIKVADISNDQSNGVITTTITNANMVVDDMVGKNVTVISYDINKEDFTAPTYQMLTFKDADGNICDRFNTVAGAKMIATGGDFTYVERTTRPWVGHYTCDAPQSVKAYYAPYGSDQWTELAFNENKDKYFMPAFGHFYEADLSSVVAQDDDMWFDVRIEMTDVAGNSQQQTISPAFLVKTANAIDQVAVTSSGLVVAGKTVRLADGKAASIVVRSIDGRTLQSAYASEVDLGAMGAGIYVVTATTADGRVVSTKVMM